MEMVVAEDRILVFKDTLNEEEASAIAWKNKNKAFGTINKVTNFLTRPKDEDFEVVYKEHRYQPFWHIKAKSKYVYDRTVEHQWPSTGPEVLEITLQGQNYKTRNGDVFISVLEHCQQEESQEVFIDGLTGVKQVSLKKYLECAVEEKNKEDFLLLAEQNIVIPPHNRGSGFVREIASKMIHSIEADKIFEESVQFEHVDLYYRPVFAFRYHWASKNKEAVVEVNAVTGEVTYSQESFQQLMGKVLDYDFLFDIGKDAASMFIPGGSIAVKIAKKYIDVTKQRQN